MNPITLPETPYKGLMPYTKEDEPFFFGRTRERDLIAANLMASRLTLLYGPSGVGKSSVINAGVVPQLQELARKNIRARGVADSIVIVFSSWRDDPIEGLKQQISAAVREILPGVQAPITDASNLTDYLEKWIEITGTELLIILDQFEEYFLYHAQDTAEGTLAVELPRAINRPGLQANFLISIRDDGLARLDFFKGRIPNLFDNYLRIEHLNHNAGREAIEKPIDQYNRLNSANEPVLIETQLVDAVLNQVKIGQVLWSVGGQGAVGSQAETSQIETPYLQLVMTRLWEEEIAQRSSVLRLETLSRLGGASNIVRTHLDKTISALSAAEQETATQVFRYLVTPSGAKIALTAADLANYTDLPEEEVSLILGKLSRDVRILRPIQPPAGIQTATRYEIFHDVLATSVLDWQTRSAYERELTSAKRTLKELAVPGVLACIIENLICWLPVGTLIVWLMLRQKEIDRQEGLLKAILIGWTIGWAVSILFLFVFGFALGLPIRAALSPSHPDLAKTLVIIVIVVLAVLRSVFSPLGSVFAVKRWRREARTNALWRHSSSLQH
ncbi:MAG: nSTAND1 domain-containing NTPase [Pyrinomonadaceae bacterium]